MVCQPAFQKLGYCPKNTSKLLFYAPKNGTLIVNIYKNVNFISLAEKLKKETSFNIKGRQLLGKTKMVR